MELKKEEIEKFQEILKSKSDEEVLEMYQNIKSYEEEIKDLVVEEFNTRNLKIEEKIEKEVKKPRSMLRVFLLIVAGISFFQMVIGDKFNGLLLAIIIFIIYFIFKIIIQSKKNFVIGVFIIMVLSVSITLYKAKKNDENNKKIIEDGKIISSQDEEIMGKIEEKEAEREMYLREKYDTKEMKNARKMIEKLTAELIKNGENAEIYFERGKANKILKRNVEANDDYSKAIFLDNNKSKYYISRAELYKDSEELEKDIKTVLELEKNDEIYSQIGGIYFRKEMYEEAIKYYEKALSVNKINKEILGNLISCYVITEKSERALELSDIYIKKFPKDYNGYLYKGFIYRKKEENSKALLCYKQGLNKFKNAAELYNEIGVVKSNLGEYKSAIKYLRCAENMNTKEKWVNAKSFADEGRIYENLENIPKAIEAYKNEIKVMEKNENIDEYKNNTKIAYNKIAELYEQLGDKNKSNEYYEKVNEIIEYRNQIFRTH